MKFFRSCFFLFVCILSCNAAMADYTDHRGKNIDSLEKVVAGRTLQTIAALPQEEADSVIMACKELMWGYLQTNKERSMAYARMVMDYCSRVGYWYSAEDGARILGMHFYAAQQWDSASFYYNRCLDMLKNMEDKVTTPFNAGKIYDQATVDDAKSAIYGSLGNMYNIMDSIPLAMEYYKKAGELFEKNGWNESNAILWYNMGETWLEEGDLAQAEECYQKSLRYARESGDSLQISSPLKGLGALYLAQGKTSKALRCLQEADEYYSLHEDQEFRARLETLDVMRKVLEQQKKQLRYMFFGALALVVLVLALMLILRRMKILRYQKQGADQALTEAVEEAAASLSPESSNDILLSDREQSVLSMLTEGKTSPQIAEKLCLSIPTIKWYRKKLLNKFEATNTADLIFKAKEKGLI